MSQDDGGNFGNDNISPALPWKRIGTFTKACKPSSAKQNLLRRCALCHVERSETSFSVRQESEEGKSNSKRFLHFGRNDRWQSCEQTAKDATVVDHRYRRIAGDTPAPTTLAPLQLG